MVKQKLESYILKNVNTYDQMILRQRLRSIMVLVTFTCRWERLQIYKIFETWTIRASYKPLMVWLDWLFVYGYRRFCSNFGKTKPRKLPSKNERIVMNKNITTNKMENSKPVQKDCDGFPLDYYPD